MNGEGLDAAAFRRALGRFGSGVTVIAARGASGEDQGMTASAFSSLSLSPPLVMVAVRKQGRMHAHLTSAPGFGVNVLSEGQEGLATRFAGGLIKAGAWTPWPEGRDKFADLYFERGAASGAALFEGSLVSLDCVRHAEVEGGDHTIFVGKVLGVRFAPDGTALRPLLHFAGAYRALAGDPGQDAEAGLRVPDWFD